ncbi:lipopolysaccharide biosynthesis protein [Enterococcus gallinarum]|uniref:lipopolysaccharide biosynthesis protein n=1 Tax=Enterococcus gallinarum TaxID=1353 RepID=UPI002433F3A2|nr:oligosaccharide flippase family protein [Enterococcus gallinarum]MDL4908500.1 oligosaccharide flippase family protein [Enterococcus gallinarum]
MPFIKTLKQSKLIKSSLWYTLGNFFIKGISFITVPIFVRITTQSEYGLINNFTSFVSIFSIILGLSLNASINNANFDYSERIKQYLSSVLSLATLSFAIFSFLGNIYFLFYEDFFDMNQLIFNLMLIQSFSLFLVSYIQAYFTINFQHFKFLFVSLVSTVLNIGISVLLMETVLFNDKYFGRALGGALGLSWVAFLICFYIFFKGKVFYNIEFWRYSLKISLPLIPHTLANILLAQFDRIMINNSLGSESAGIYSYISNIAIVLNVIWLSSNNAWVPWFYREMENRNNTKIKLTSNLYILIFSIVTLTLMVFCVDVSRLLADESYFSGIPLIVPIILGYFFQFMYSFPVNVEFYMKKTSYIAIGTMTSAIVNILLNLLFIPKFGIMAAGYTTAFTYFLLFIFHYNLSKKIVKRQYFDTSFIVFITVVVLIFSIIIHYLIHFFLARYFILIIFIILIGLVYYKNYND